MRFEKVSDDKIIITLTSKDLQANNIDFHDFMSNSMDSQDLFFDMLKEAERKIGFVTENYLIKIEAFAIAGNKFVFTITRFLPYNDSIPDKPKTIPKKRLYAKRKSVNVNSDRLIYSFASFDDFCSFCKNYKILFKAANFANRVVLYEYHSTYYLVISDINFGFKNLKNLFSCITEFANYTSNYDLFERKLSEYANLVMENNAIEVALRFM